MGPTFTLGEIASRIGAVLQGDGEYRISRLNTLRDAGPEDLAFLDNETYRRYLKNTAAGGVILHPDMAAEYTGNCLVMDKPYLGYARASALFATEPKPAAGIDPAARVSAQAEVAGSASVGPGAVIADGAKIGEGTVVGAGCFVGEGSILGRNCRIFANVTLYHGVRIGDNVRIHSGAVIGSDGFGFAPSGEGWVKIHQLGGVVVGDNVEIGACTSIDRGALNDTVIGRGVIIDNQVQIAHNVQVGENTALAGCVGVSGSASIGKNCLLAGGVGVVGHVSICDGVTVTAMSIVTKSITEPGSYSSGTPVSATREWRRNAARFNQLDTLASRLKALEKKR